MSGVEIVEERETLHQRIRLQGRVITSLLIGKFGNRLRHVQVLGVGNVRSDLIVSTLRADLSRHPRDLAQRLYHFDSR